MTNSAIVLVGAPGAGKSTIGGLLAAELGLPFFDVDEVISAEAGTSVATIFAEHGEARFRELERDAIARLVQQPAVLSLGGGAVVHPDTRAALRGHRVIWLQVDIDEAASRIGSSGSRPLLAGNVRARLAQLVAERQGWYRDVATWTVDTTGRTPDQVVQVIVANLDMEES